MGKKGVQPQQMQHLIRLGFLARNPAQCKAATLTFLLPNQGDVSASTAEQQSGKQRNVFIKQLWDTKLFILTLFSSSSEAQGESLRFCKK